MNNVSKTKPACLSSDLTALSGIGEKTAGLFAKCGINQIRDLIETLPRSYDRYEDIVPISQLRAGEKQTVSGTICAPIRSGRNRKLAVTSTVISDLSGKVNVCWFRQPYLRKTLHSGQALILRGVCSLGNRGLTITQPEIFRSADQYNLKLHTMQPQYRRTAGLSNQAYIKAVRQALTYADSLEDPLEGSILSKYGLIHIREAYHDIHFPETDDQYRQGRARLCFDEFLAFILRLRYFCSSSQESLCAAPLRPGALTEKLLSSLPYSLTEGQSHALKEILNDMSRAEAMSRLVQGDVGCGKTIIAILSLLTAVDSGYQGALMAPTQVLALQHYKTLTELFEKYQIGCRVDLLTGQTSAAEKKIIYQHMKDGRPQIFVGTQTLIQKSADFSNLALVVTDEQHRFGVRQRTALAEKGNDGKSPHVLVMSATPIPRTLGIILYGDLSITTIHDMPAGRLPVKNAVMNSSERGKVLNFIKKKIEEGRQAYCICPLVEESEAVAGQAVTAYIDALRSALGSAIRVEMLHGRMNGEEKNLILSDFAAGQIDVLVSTTVIEVGINVPNATVMLIENADRFGLAQLHQLRGRIRRGNDQPYCIFLTGREDARVKERLDVIGTCNDGFEIAQQDLKLRGPGDLFGLTQSGFLSFEIGDIYQDHEILMKASQAADEILERDPLLQDPNNGLLRELIMRGGHSSLAETERTL